MSAKGEKMGFGEAWIKFFLTFLGLLPVAAIAWGCWQFMQFEGRSTSDVAAFLVAVLIALLIGGLLESLCLAAIYSLWAERMFPRPPLK